ncbi:MAG: endonuclease/exonuclease/phosphatase family protein [Chloroflexota bacterium]|nr:endonuclease/exonuclease/phosphatase family protein [Chloroflexota bacterium]
MQLKFKNKTKIMLIMWIGACLLLFLTGCRTTKTPDLIDIDEETTASSLTAQESPTPERVGNTIAEIQGAGHITPYRNQEVQHVEGVVIFVQSDGFYLQSLVPDGDPATSEGIFVFTDSPPSVRIGDQVALNARVIEDIPGGGYGNLSITTLKNPEVTVISSGNDLPSPTVIGEGGRMPPTEIIDDDTSGFISEKAFFDPENDGLDFYESLEGMLVQVNDAIVVGPTNAYKEIVVLADSGKNSGVRSIRGGVVIRENDFNPERIMLDDKLEATPFVNVGDFSEEPIIGVMDYDYGNFKIQVTNEIDFISGGLAPESAFEPSDDGQIRVASYNVYNLSALDTQRIAQLADQIVRNLASPDIIAFQEIMDNDGSEGDKAVSADQTYQGIIDAIRELGGPEYNYVDIDPLPDSEGGINLGNIRQGVIYRLDSGLSLAEAPPGDARTPIEISEGEGVPVLSLNPGRVDPTNPAFYSSRRPLVVTFWYKGDPLFMINNHFNSKGQDRGLFGEFQPPLLESEPQRIGQAQVVHDFVADLLAVDPDSRVIVLGDLNDFQFSKPIEIIKGEILQDLMETLPIEEQYTYIYEGNSQVLDHILITAGLADAFDAMDIVHINCEYEYSSRLSDHDVLVAAFTIE